MKLIQIQAGMKLKSSGNIPKSSSVDQVLIPFPFHFPNDVFVYYS